MNVRDALTYLIEQTPLDEDPRLAGEPLADAILAARWRPPMTGPASARFELHRDTDVSGVSGTGVVADGVRFPDGVVALRWRGGFPTSVVFHDRGMEAVEAVHGHGGQTRVVWLDEWAK